MMTLMKEFHGKYIGAEKSLQGEAAILIETPDGQYRAQFDNLELPFWLTHSWTDYAKSDFALDGRRTEDEGDWIDDHSLLRGQP